jgi:hypothetical protein
MSVTLVLGFYIYTAGELITGVGYFSIFLGCSTGSTGVDTVSLGTGGLIFSGRGLGGGTVDYTLLLLYHMLLS